MKPCKPRSSKKLGKLELHCCFCLCKHVQTRLHLISNYVRNFTDFLEGRGHRLQDWIKWEWSVTSKWCGSWWLLKKPGKKSQKEQNIYINDSFFCIFQAECQRMAYESRRPHLQSSWVVQGFITFSTESLHRHEVFAASFSALKTHQDFAKCWFFWFLSTKFTIKTYPLGVDVSKFRNVAPLFTVHVKCWTNDHLWGHFGLQCFHGFIWHGHPGGHAKCSWSKTAAPRPCQSKSWDVTTSGGKSSNYDL